MPGRGTQPDPSSREVPADGNTPGTCHVGHAPEPIPGPKMGESTGCHWPGALWNLALLLLIYSIMSASSARSWQATGMRVLLYLAAMVFPCLVVRLRGPCLLQSAIAYKSARVVGLVGNPPFVFQLCVHSTQVLHRPLHNTMVGSIMCYMCAMMWMFRARMCVNWMCCMRLGFSRVVFMVLE